MTADLLRQAADRLDALADAATPGPWDNALGPVAGWPEANRAQLVARPFNGADAVYIAAMSPTVGKTLAEWLGATADEWDANGRYHLPSNRAALAIARAILGGDA